MTLVCRLVLVLRDSVQICMKRIWNNMISIQLRTVISICQNQKQTNLRLRKIDLFHIFLHDKVIKIGIQFPKWFERKVVNIWSTFSQWRIIRPHPNPKIWGGYERGFPSPIEGVRGPPPIKFWKNEAIWWYLKCIWTEFTRDSVSVNNDN